MQPSKVRQSLEITMISHKDAVPVTNSSHFLILILILIDNLTVRLSQTEMAHALSTFWRRICIMISRRHDLFSTAKDGSTANDADVPGTPQVFQKSESADFSNASVKRPVLAVVGNHIDCESTSCDPETAHPLSQFQRLPPELIKEITQYLPLSNALSLSITCRVFREKVEAGVEDLDYLIEMKSFLKDPKESKPERGAVLERLHFLCMLERDGLLSASKAVCRGCKTTHNVSVFSSTALQQQPQQRLCMGLEGKIWICPHRIWDHAKLQQVEKQDSYPRESMAKCGCPNGEVLTSSPLRRTSLLEEYSLFVFYPVLAMPRGSIFRTASIKKALRALGVNICPHLRFGDPKVLDAFHSGCPRLRDLSSWEKCARCVSPRPRSEPGVEVNCESCLTQTVFYLRESDGKTTTLWAKAIRRVVQWAGTVTDPAWIACLNMPGDFERLQEDWQAMSMRRSPHNGKHVGMKGETRRKESFVRGFIGR